MADNNDIGKIVSLIMENPHIVDEISALAKASADKTPEPTPSDAPIPEISEPTVINEESSVPVSSAPPLVDNTKRSRREGLISALKPYMSAERARAVDSMMQVASILELMRR